MPAKNVERLHSTDLSAKSFWPAPNFYRSVDSALKAICGIYLLGRLEEVLESYGGSPVVLVGRLFAAVDRKPYDPTSYPSLPELEAEIGFVRKYKRSPKNEREVTRMREWEKRKKGKSVLWFEEATSEGVDGWREVLAQLRLLRQLEDECRFFDGLQPHRFFDLIAGTGLGGLAAICLGKANMSVVEVEALVSELVAAAEQLQGGSEADGSVVGSPWLLSYVSRMIGWADPDPDLERRGRLALKIDEIVGRHLHASRSSPRSQQPLMALMDDDSHLRLCEKLATASAGDGSDHRDLDDVTVACAAGDHGEESEGDRICRQQVAERADDGTERNTADGRSAEQTTAKVLVMTKRSPASASLQGSMSDENERKIGARGGALYLKLYGDQVAMPPGSLNVIDACSEAERAATTLKDAAIAALASASPGLLDPTKLADATVGGPDGGGNTGLGGRGRDMVLLEMQRVWPQWDLKLLLSLGSGSSSPSSSSSSSSSSAVSWALSVLADHLSSFAGYVSRDRGKDAWDKARERRLDEVDTNDGGVERVATVLGVRSWRLQTFDPDRESPPSSMKEKKRPTRDLLRQSIASLVWMNERSDGEEQKSGTNSGAKGEGRKRWNLLHLHPSAMAAGAEDREILRRLAARVKKSMRQMESEAAAAAEDEPEDEKDDEGDERQDGDDDDERPLDGGEEDSSWVLV